MNRKLAQKGSWINLTRAASRAEAMCVTGKPGGSPDFQLSFNLALSLTFTVGSMNFQIMNSIESKSIDALIRTRRTVHQYKPQMVPDELVKKALELSLWAPNHRLTFPWRYFMVSEEQRAQFVDLSVELKVKKDPSFSKIKEVGLRKRLNESSHWVALGIKKNPNPDIFQEDLCTLACSVQIISLSLWEQGVATKWSTGGFSMHSKSYEILGANPEEIYLMGALFIGYADIMPHAPPRPPLSEFLIEGK